MAAFMQKGILEADRVLLVCSRSYVTKADGGAGGVGFERLIVTSELVENIDTRKFIPLVRDNPEEPRIPRFLGPRLYLDFSEDSHYEERREELLRHLLGAPLLHKPPLGTNPFSGELPKSQSPARVVSPNGMTRSGTQLLSDKWFEAERSVAERGIGQLGLNACMELRFGLHAELAKSQLDLLNAVRNSQINSFGWPIGVVLENRDEFSPRPYSDGIKAEIAIQKDGLSGRQTYDYWAARKNGDFFLLQSLFEDARGEKVIYFNTRIVRVTGALMFASNFYTNLGSSPDANMSIRVSHRGLSGRTLAAVGNRGVFPRMSHEETAESEIVVVVGKIRETLVENVQRLVAPMFMLFEFQEFADSVYMDIVRRFEKGETS